ITSKEVPPIVRKPVIASATGWALSGWRKEEPIAFPLSCHADFAQLMQYVETVNPKAVLTLHGFSEEFARQVRKRLGIEARPVPPFCQKALQEYIE
ncbi:MAG: MBL fold metallo-hydrolase RNA specificity domain-containing protein, partial [Candidatus Bathyarchaeia archaeon]